MSSIGILMILAAWFCWIFPMIVAYPGKSKPYWIASIFVFCSAVTVTIIVLIGEKIL